MSRVDQGFRFAQTLAQPGALRAFLRSPKFSSSAFIMARDLRAGCGEFGSVIDVGANVGQFTLAMARENPQARIVALEPLPDVAAELRARTRSVPGIEVLEYAAGSTTESATIHRHAHSKSSSLLPTLSQFGETYPLSLRGGQTAVEVHVARLDDVVDLESLTPPVLLKLDVQGYEIEALTGAQLLLERCDFVLAEASMAMLYDGEPVFEDLHAHMRSVGFVFDRPVDFLRGARGTVSEMDVLYRRGLR